MLNMQVRPASLLAKCQRVPFRPCSCAQLKRCRRRTVIARALAIQAPTTSGSVTISPRPELLRAIKSIYTNVSFSKHLCSWAYLPFASQEWGVNKIHVMQEYEESAFASNYSIEGPLFTCSSREELKRARSLLLTLADVSYVVQSLSSVEGNKLRARCSFCPWASSA